MENLAAQVIIYNNSSKTDKPFTYLIEDRMKDNIQEGMRVAVPFGVGNRIIQGIVVRIFEWKDKTKNLKYIADALDFEPILSKNMIELSLWMRENYLCSYLDAFHLVMPPGDFKEIRTVLNVNNVPLKNLTKEEEKIVGCINQKGKCYLDDVKKFMDHENANKIINNLKKKNIVYNTLEIETKINKKLEKYISLSSNQSKDDILKDISSRGKKQIEVVNYLYKKKGAFIKNLMEDTKASYQTIKALADKGLIKVTETEVFRNVIKSDISPYKRFKLTPEQLKCFNTILDDINKNGSFLIHGVTGSGKTEIYLQIIEEMIKAGKDTIVLVPEISLTPQTIERFVGRFGSNVAVLHSKLSYGERFDEWRKIKEGKVKIAIGARSAVFAPFNNLGLIIIDEEHETSYKSGMNPKYSAYEVARKRCDMEGSSLILGTATPSVETYNSVLNGEIKLFVLKKRINNKKMPVMDIIDMREELNNGNNSIFSRKLYKEIEENLKEGKQTILFLNRRGYSTFVSCRKCGYVIKCKSCDITMTYHIQENKLKCHYCGKEMIAPKICPKCGSNYIKYFGIGTQKVEEQVKKYFPKASVERMDTDTVTKKGSHERIFGRMKRGETDILIGTQMISKGLDFPNVTLVGIIAADTSLNLPDYRSSERTFQLLTQVAGRAGRGDFEGRVIVQTYNPEHFSIQMAKDYNYEGFFDREILLRKEFEFPPFTNILSIIVYGKEKEQVINVSKDIHSEIIKNLELIYDYNLIRNIYGPNPALIEKIKDNYRWQILFKCSDEDLFQLKDIIRRVCINNRDDKKYRGVKFNIDINPSSIL